MGKSHPCSLQEFVDANSDFRSLFYQLLALRVQLAEESNQLSRWHILEDFEEARNSLGEEF